MKTYKQLYQQAMNNNHKLHNEFIELREKLWSCERALKENGLVNPVVHSDLLLKYALALDGLRAVRAINPNLGMASCVAQEVLEQLGEKV